MTAPPALTRAPALCRAAALGLLLLPLVPALVSAQGLPPSTLAVRHGGTWRTWWTAEHAPRYWRAPRRDVAGAVQWTKLRPGMDWGELEVSTGGSARRLDVVLVRLDPRQARVELMRAVRDAGTRGAWTVDSVPQGAVLGLNAGQFRDGAPWGWVVSRGRELQPPGAGPLSMALVVDASGAVGLVPVEEIDAARAGGRVAEAFQSYPVLLSGDGRVPEQLTAPGRGVDVDHRDSRLAIGELRDGRLLIALTRFGGLGGAAGGLPFGPTTPEMAALMGALGCRVAMLLDGGLSGQLLIRDQRGRVRAWRGWRRVPLGMVVRPRR